MQTRHKRVIRYDLQWRTVSAQLLVKYKLLVANTSGMNASDPELINTNYSAQVLMRFSLHFHSNAQRSRCVILRSNLHLEKR